MAALLTGGASSAPAASTHLRCERFTGTDPLVTGTSRRQLASQLGAPDDVGSIPEARWVRAMTFERLVQRQPFATRFVSHAVGPVGLERPAGVISTSAGASGRAQGDESLARTADALRTAHHLAVQDRYATLLHNLTVPFPYMEEDEATPLKPDFAIVAPHNGASVLLVGDTKDYERIRSSIEDSRLLKGFLQVALGAVAVERGGQLPPGMTVHNHGVLAVPQDAFMQPEPKVEDLTDHMAEVTARITERVNVLNETGPVTDPKSHARHLKATFDPDACPSCSLFRFCRSELRTKAQRDDGTASLESLFVEVGVPESRHAALLQMLTDGETPGHLPVSLLRQVEATMTGTVEPTGLRRTDPLGEVGTVEAAIVKSDAATLGMHGIAVRRHTPTGPTDWDTRVFSEPHSPDTRRQVMRALGRHINHALQETRALNTTGEDDDQLPVHLVVPDSATEDILVSIADNVAGVELARLRWQRDLDMGREPVTKDGDPADVPTKVRPHERLAASFLLEADRSRALALRSAVVSAQRVLAEHVVVGGPARNALRLDYLLRWTDTLVNGPLADWRKLEDDIEATEFTPGARETSNRSDQLHQQRPSPQQSYSGQYEQLVVESLAYKQRCLERTVEALTHFPDSQLRAAHRNLEGGAQVVWRRRQQLQSGDLVRFGRVHNFWRDDQVGQINDDVRAATQLAALTNPTAATDQALDPGNRDLVFATVMTADPLTIQVNSRRLNAGDRMQILHIDGTPVVDSQPVDVKLQKGSIKMTGIPVVVLHETEHRMVFELEPGQDPSQPLALGSTLVLAPTTFLRDFSNPAHGAVDRPSADSIAAPKPDCTEETFQFDPESHRWCCRPHQVTEADTADYFAAEREAGRANPEAWPPVIDDDQFETPGRGAPTAETEEVPTTTPPPDLSLSDID